MRNLSVVGILRVYSRCISHPNGFMYKFVRLRDTRVTQVSPGGVVKGTLEDPAML